LLWPTASAARARASSGTNQLRKKEPEKVPIRDKVTFSMENLSCRMGWWNMLKIRARMLLGLKV